MILLVLNYSEELSEEDIKLFEAVSGMDIIVIVNKTDLEPKLDVDKVKQLAKDRPVVTTSLLQEKGIDELEMAIQSLFFTGSIESGDLTYVSNTRHIALLQAAKQSIEDALEGIEMDIPIDIVQIDLTRCWEQLGEIIGDAVHESLIDQLFSQFCLGK